MIAVIIQARLGSARLPRKVLEEIAPNTNMLQMVIRRVKKAKYVDKVIVALANDSKELIPMIEAEGVEYNWYPFPDRNILEEYFKSATKFGADTIIRVTADCPLIDPQTIDQLISMFIPSKCDIMFTHNDNLIGGGVEIDGLDLEIFSFSALYRAYTEASTSYDKEHCTPWMYANLKKQKMEMGWTDEILPEWIDKCNQVKLSVNTPEELDRVRKIVSVLGTDFYTKQLTEYLSKNKP